MDSTNWPRRLTRQERLDQAEDRAASARREFEQNPTPLRQAAVRVAEFAVEVIRAIR